MLFVVAFSIIIYFHIASVENALASYVINRVISYWPSNMSEVNCVGLRQAFSIKGKHRYTYRIHVHRIHVTLPGNLCSKTGKTFYCFVCTNQYLIQC